MVRALATENVGASLQPLQSTNLINVVLQNGTYLLTWKLRAQMPFGSIEARPLKIK